MLALGCIVYCGPSLAARPTLSHYLTSLLFSPFRDLLFGDTSLSAVQERNHRTRDGLACRTLWVKKVSRSVLVFILLGQVRAALSRGCNPISDPKQP